MPFKISRVATSRVGDSRRMSEAEQTYLGPESIDRWVLALLHVFCCPPLWSAMGWCQLREYFGRSGSSTYRAILLSAARNAMNMYQGTNVAQWWSFWPQKVEVIGSIPSYLKAQKPHWPQDRRSQNLPRGGGIDAKWRWWYGFVPGNEKLGIWRSLIRRFRFRLNHALRTSI